MLDEAVSTFPVDRGVDDRRDEEARPGLTVEPAEMDMVIRSLASGEGSP